MTYTYNYGYGYINYLKYIFTKATSNQTDVKGVKNYS